MDYKKNATIEALEQRNKQNREILNHFQQKLSEYSTQLDIPKLKALVNKIGEIQTEIELNEIGIEDEYANIRDGVSSEDNIVPFTNSIVKQF